MLRNLRYSARSFIRTPGLALALLFTIALGIASIVSVRGFVDGLTKPLFPLGSLDRLVSVFGRDAQREADPLSKQQYLYARSRHDVFQWVGAARVAPGTITMDGQTTFVFGSHLGQRTHRGRAGKPPGGVVRQGHDHRADPAAVPARRPDGPGQAGRIADPARAGRDG